MWVHYRVTYSCIVASACKCSRRLVFNQLRGGVLLVRSVAAGRQIESIEHAIIVDAGNADALSKNVRE